MGAIGAIAVNAFRESLRDKILYNLVLFAGLLIGLSVLLADLTITEHHKIIADMGLAAINVVGVIIAVFVGISLVNKEIERRTVYTIMARPISRTAFILGKYLGLAFTLFVNLAIMLCVFLATLWLYRVPISGALFQSIHLMFVEILIVTAVALFFSTFSSATLSAIFTLGLYVVGHLTADVRSLAGDRAPMLVRSALDLFYYVFPNLEMMNIKGQAAVGIAASAQYVLVASLYGVAYAGVMLTAACAVFQRRDF